MPPLFAFLFCLWVLYIASNQQKAPVMTIVEEFVWYWLHCNAPTKTLLRKHVHCPAFPPSIHPNPQIYISAMICADTNRWKINKTSAAPTNIAPAVSITFVHTFSVTFESMKMLQKIVVRKNETDQNNCDLCKHELGERYMSDRPTCIIAILYAIPISLPATRIKCVLCMFQIHVEYPCKNIQMYLFYGWTKLRATVWS